MKPKKKKHRKTFKKMQIFCVILPRKVYVLMILVPCSMMVMYN